MIIERATAARRSARCSDPSIITPPRSITAAMTVKLSAFCAAARAVLQFHGRTDGMSRTTKGLRQTGKVMFRKIDTRVLELPSALLDLDQREAGIHEDHEEWS